MLAGGSVRLRDAMPNVKMYDIGVLGLGYVGLTLATVLAEVGRSVIGIEKRADVVDLTN